MVLEDYRRKIIANSPHLASASGAVASFSDGADLPLKSLLVDIDPVQSGTGDPSPSNVRPISGWNAVNVKNGNTVIATISLGQTVYGATINPLTGVMTVDRAMVDLGTLNWTRINTQSPHWRFWALVTGMLKDSTLMSNQYAQITPSAQWTGAIGIATQLISGTPAVMVTDERYETAADFKTAMSGVQLVYELATPYEIQLTPQQIRTLYGDNTIFADAGNVALEYWAHP